MIATQKKLLASVRPGNVLVKTYTGTHIRSFVNKIDDKDIEMNKVTNAIVRSYHTKILDRRERINKVMKRIYGRPIPIKEQYIGDTLFRICDMTSRKASPDVMATEIRKYLGYHCSFFRKKGRKKTVIKSSVIEAAYDLCQRGAPVIEVKYLLYIQ